MMLVFLLLASARKGERGHTLKIKEMRRDQWKGIDGRGSMEGWEDYFVVFIYTPIFTVS